MKSIFEEETTIDYEFLGVTKDFYEWLYLVEKVLDKQICSKCNPLERISREHLLFVRKFVKWYMFTPIAKLGKETISAKTIYFDSLEELETLVDWNKSVLYTITNHFSKSGVSIKLRYAEVNSDLDEILEITNEDRN